MPSVADGGAVARTGFRLQRADAVLLGASLAWGVFVLAWYYEQLWSLIASGPQAWNFSDFHHELRATGLPYFSEAARRAISGIASAAIVASACIALGMAADRWLTPVLPSHERLVVRFANGAGVLSLVLLSLTLAGAYRPSVVGTIVAALAVVAAARGIRAWHVRVRAPSSRWWPQPELYDIPWIAVSATAAVLAFLTALAPETAYDALWYHLELPRRWLEAGTLTDNVHEYISLYPGTWELLFGAALALDGTVGAQLLHWTTLAAGAVIAASFSTRAFGSRAAWPAAAIFVTAPTVFWESTSAYVDLALALHAGLAVGALWQSTRMADRRWVLLAGFQLGLACATKHLGLVIAAIAIALVVIGHLRRQGAKPLIRTVAVVSLLMILIPSPWYLRAWLASGNPVFPEMYSVFGASPPGRWDERAETGLAAFKAGFGPPRSPGIIAALPWDMTMHAWRYGGTLGPFLLLLLPGVGLLVRRNHAARWLFAGAIAYLLVWVSPISSYQLRFLVPWWVVMSALLAGSIALLAATAARVWPPARPGVHIGLAALALMNLPPFTPLHEREREGWTRWLTHVVHRVPLEVVTGLTSANDYLRQAVRSYGAWQFLNAHAPADARVLTFFGGDHFYAARARLWSESVAARQVTWEAVDTSSGEVLQALHRLGITHLLVPRRPPNRTPEHDRIAVLRPDVLSRSPVVYEDYWATIYRVVPAPWRDPSRSGAAPEGDAILSSDQR